MRADPNSGLPMKEKTIRQGAPRALSRTIWQIAKTSS